MQPVISLLESKKLSKEISPELDRKLNNFITCWADTLLILTPLSKCSHLLFSSRHTFGSVVTHQ